MDSFKHTLKTRMNALMFPEKYFKNFAIFMFALGIFVASLMIIAGVIVSIALCVNNATLDYVWIMFCSPIAALVEFAVFEFLAMLFAGLADMIENTKKQTEILKVVAIKE